MSESKSSIFVADDDEAVRKALRRLIISFGYCVEKFASAQEFLDSATVDAEGFLILDMLMPRMNGFQLHLSKVHLNTK